MFFGKLLPEITRFHQNSLIILGYPDTKKKGEKEKMIQLNDIRQKQRERERKIKLKKVK